MFSCPRTVQATVAVVIFAAMLSPAEAQPQSGSSSTAVTAAELDAFIAASRKNSFHVAELMMSNPQKAKAVVLAGLRQRPGDWLWTGDLRMIFSEDQRRARQLPPDKRAAFYKPWAALLQELARGMQSARADATQQQNLRMNAGQIREMLALAALEAGDLQTARQAATMMLKENTDPKSWNYGNVVHNANQILGRIALRSGDLSGASGYLLEAGKTPGSPQLNSFGPRMTLARELLEKGQREVVLQYLDLVARFWASPGTDRSRASIAKRNAAKLAKWKQEIQAGRIPADQKWR